MAGHFFGVILWPIHGPSNKNISQIAVYCGSQETRNYKQLNKNKWYTFLKGETNEHSATTPESANNRPTSATLRMFSSLSSGENPRFLFNPVRMLSPSNPYDGMPKI